MLLSQARRMGSEPQDERQFQQSLETLVQKLCSVPLPQERPTLDPVGSVQESDGILAEVLRDKEVEELLLRKIREKGIAGKFVSGEAERGR